MTSILRRSVNFSFVVENVLDVKAGLGKLHDIHGISKKTVYFEYLAIPYIGMELIML